MPKVLRYFVFVGIVGVAIAATTRVGSNLLGMNVLVGGLPIAARGALNFQAGAGCVIAASDNPSQNRVDLTSSMNSAVAATHDQIHWNDTYCVLTSQGVSTYQCQMSNRALASYKAGMLIEFVPDVACASGCSLNIDGIGPVAIKQIDGVSEPGSQLTQVLHLLWHDGSIFRIRL